ncbi:TIGR00270 family protein [Candidatus Woesearchaeota archaeon]|nr:TIGR00270 family protein [Candidatus Woesearchaeota archaeon]
MMQCEMCGRDTELVISLIEGTELRVCRDCAKHGKVLRPVPSAPQPRKKPKPAEPASPEPEIIEVITDDYAKKVKEARERLGLKQKDFAKKLSEKEALLHKVETGKYMPSLLLARKLEHALNITLVEKHEEKHDTENKRRTETFTIGDMISIKKR